MHDCEPSLGDKTGLNLKTISISEYTPNQNDVNRLLSTTNYFENEHKTWLGLNLNQGMLKTQ